MDYILQFRKILKNIFDCKVHIFWEGHKILRNLHRRFDRYYIYRTNLGWRFRKNLWLSQNIWTLKNLGNRFLSHNIICVAKSACKKYYLRIKSLH